MQGKVFWFCMMSWYCKMSALECRQVWALLHPLIIIQPGYHMPEFIPHLFNHPSMHLLIYYWIFMEVQRNSAYILITRWFIFHVSQRSNSLCCISVAGHGSVCMRPMHAKNKTGFSSSLSREGQWWGILSCLPLSPRLRIKQQAISISSLTQTS